MSRQKNVRNTIRYVPEHFTINESETLQNLGLGSNIMQQKQEYFAFPSQAH